MLRVNSLGIFLFFRKILPFPHVPLCSLSTQPGTVLAASELTVDLVLQHR